MSGHEPPLFEIGQAVLVDQGLPGEVTACQRGSAPSLIGDAPEDTWLYAVGEAERIASPVSRLSRSA